MSSADPFRTRQFDRAADRYNRLTTVQRTMASRLMELLPSPIRAKALLELGSGTGHLTRLLLKRCGARRVVVTDLSEVMLAACRGELGAAHAGIQWQRLDASHFDDDWRRLKTMGPFDLVASNALVQWLPDPAAHLAAIRAVLSPTGRYLVSGFSGNHFPEFRAILERPPFGFPPLPGFGLERLAELAATEGLRVCRSASDTIPTQHPSVRSLLHLLRDMGASRYPTAPRLTPSLLRRFEAMYAARHTTPAGVVCTWKPWYALLEAQSET